MPLKSYTIIRNQFKTDDSDKQRNWGLGKKIKSEIQ